MRMDIYTGLVLVICLVFVILGRCISLFFFFGRCISLFFSLVVTSDFFFVSETPQIPDADNLRCVCMSDVVVVVWCVCAASISGKIAYSRMNDEYINECK